MSGFNFSIESDSFFQLSQLFLFPFFHVMHMHKLLLHFVSACMFDQYLVLVYKVDVGIL